MDIAKTLMYSDAGSVINNLALLVFRVLLSVQLFRVHGMKKFPVLGGKMENVPNPFNLPKKLNSSLAAIADTMVPLLIILGTGSRLIVIPVIVVTLTGYLVVHRDDSPEVRDVPYMYALSFLFLSVLGFGTCSLDHYLLTKFFKP